MTRLSEAIAGKFGDWVTIFFLVVLSFFAARSVIADQQQNADRDTDRKSYDLAACERGNDLRRNLVGLAVDLGAGPEDVASVEARFPLVDCPAALAQASRP